MKDYERYMNRQKVSEIKMAQLVKLEETGRKGVGNRGKGVENRGVSREKHVPQWVKYCGMAASLVVVFGVFALAILQGGRGIAPNPIANASATPAAEELYFNEDDMITFTDEAISGDTMKLEPMEIADVALLFGSSEDDFDGFKEDMGWGEFDMEYYSVDMSPDSNASRFLLKGVYVSPMPEETKMFSSFYPVNEIWLEIYEGHSYAGEDRWKGLEACEINGHKVIATCGGLDYHARAVFDVERNGKTYGVVYAVTAYGERNAKDLVTRLVRRVTKDGLFPETYNVYDGIELVYAELTEISSDRQVCDIKSDDTDRELSGEELKKIFPAVEEELDYQWRGDGLFHADGTLRVLTIEGIRYDGSACVTITAGAEEDVFLMNSAVKSGKVTYVGAENQLWNGFRLLRGYYRYAPNYYWWWDGETLDNACLVSFQLQQSSRDLPCEITTCVKKGTLEESKAFNEQWVNTTLTKGLWLSCEERNGKTVWDLPKIDKQVELRGRYYMESEDGDALGNCAKVTIASGKITIASERLNYHTCTSTKFTRETENGTPLLRVVCDKCGGIYSFEIIDAETLRFDMDHSAVQGHHSDWTFEVSHGTTFRHLKDGEQTTTLVVLGETAHHEDEHHTEAQSVLDALDQAESELRYDMHHAEPTHQVETTHHPEEHHSNSHH